MPLPPPKPQVHSQDPCAICHKPLILSNNENLPSEPSYMIDDVQLRCGHHFHQSCIIDHARSSPSARERCTTCGANDLDTNGRYMVGVTTENGFAGSIDLGNDIDEQSFLKAKPDVARAQGFLSLMAQMDFTEAKTFLDGEDGMGEGKLSPDVRYETGGQTAMHMAAYNNDVEGVELLLRYGADKRIRDESGQTALDCAREVEAGDVVALLEG